jgi:hypothetical protein
MSRVDLGDQQAFLADAREQSFTKASAQFGVLQRA